MKKYLVALSIVLISHSWIARANDEIPYTVQCGFDVHTRFRFTVTIDEAIAACETYPREIVQCAQYQYWTHMFTSTFQKSLDQCSR